MPARLLGPRYWATWFGLGFLRLVELLPFPALLAVGRGTGWLARRLPLPYLRIARRNPAASSIRFLCPRSHWSPDHRVIAPAHRLLDSAVSARLRSARSACLPPPRLSAHRAARSRLASDPRCRPTCINSS